MSKNSKITVCSFEEAISIGKDLIEKYPIVKPTEDSLAIIMYTSGELG